MTSWTSAWPHSPWLAWRNARPYPVEPRKSTSRTAKPASATSRSLKGWNDPERLPGRAAVRIDDRRHALAAALARRRDRSPERALDPEAVARLERDPLRPPATRPGASAAPSTTGRESVTRRGRASSGAAPGTGSSHRSWGWVSLSPIAATQAPSASQPTDAPDAVPWVDPLDRSRPRPRSVASSGAGRVPVSGRPRPGRRRRDRADRRAPRRGRSGCRPARGAARSPSPPDGSPCSRSPAVSTIRSCPSAVRRTTWNQPSASDT